MGVLAAIAYDPLVRIEIGPLSISPHGIGIALGFLIGARLMLPAAKEKGIDEDQVYPLLTLAAIGAIIGARLAYVINHIGEFESPLDVFKVWQGGISLLGGFLGAIFLAGLGMKKRGISFWKLMDASAPGMALGVVVGRVGDIIVGDHLGKPTDLFFGYRCPGLDVDTASPCDPGVVVHQTALYDLLLTAVLLAVLLWLRRKPRYDGFLILTFATVYGAQRIFEDFLRDDVRRLGLTGSQITAIVLVLVCGGWLLFKRRTPGWGRWDGSDQFAPPGGAPPYGPPGRQGVPQPGRQVPTPTMARPYQPRRE
ncbi:MAG: prolipoprotein diacylglyceryl transferase [Actinomycetota bacterium]|nr:prolipoprotein diacylglyceryl transferase [Actinomycetota bacterium]